MGPHYWLWPLALVAIVALCQAELKSEISEATAHAKKCAALADVARIKHAGGKWSSANAHFHGRMHKLYETNMCLIKK